MLVLLQTNELWGKETPAHSLFVFNIAPFDYSTSSSSLSWSSAISNHFMPFPAIFRHLQAIPVLFAISSNFQQLQANPSNLLSFLGIFSHFKPFPDTFRHFQTFPAISSHFPPCTGNTCNIQSILKMSRPFQLYPALTSQFHSLQSLAAIFSHFKQFQAFLAISSHFQAF